MIKSVIKSFGGKGYSFLNNYNPFVPKHYTSLIEPFCGSMVLSLNYDKPNCSVIVNDLNKNIYNFWRVLQCPVKFPLLKAKLDMVFYSEDIFRESLKVLKGIELKSNQECNLDEVERAFHFFMVNRMCFSGNMQSWGKALTIRRGVSKSTADLFSAIDKLPELHEKLQRYIISNRDGIKLIENYSNPEYFIVADPPYCLSERGTSRYPVDMTDDDQVRLLEVLLKNRSMILLCAYKNNLYDEWLIKQGGWGYHEFKVNTVSGNKNKGKTKTESIYLSPELLKNIKNN